MPILPRRIEFGDTLGLICPASAPADPKVVDHSIAALEKMGFKVKLAKNSRKRWGFLAGHDRERAADVMQMFLDERVRGIVCLRGGYGTPRILPLLDYQKIREHPKVFVGFSDITALHCAFLKKSNLLSFHGPMTASHFTDAKSPAFSLSSWLNVMMNPKPAGSITHGYEGKTVKVLRGGKVSGDLVGGNISLLTSLIGTPFQCSYRGKILFLEDVAEEPYRLDRMLTQLLNAGLLQQVAGVAIGLCHQCEDPRARTAGEYRQTLEDVFEERLRPLKIPVVIGLPFGHVPYNATLPVGGRALLDGKRGDLVITHAAVK